MKPKSISIYDWKKIYAELLKKGCLKILSIVCKHKPKNLILDTP